MVILIIMIILVNVFSKVCTKRSFKRYEKLSAVYINIIITYTLHVTMHVQEHNSSFDLGETINWSIYFTKQMDTCCQQEINIYVCSFALSATNRPYEGPSFYSSEAIINGKLLKKCERPRIIRSNIRYIITLRHIEY